MSNPKVMSMGSGSRRSGTTLVEVLVVIVIFLVGILAIVQVFPGGFKVLRQTRDFAVGTQLNRAEIERIKGRADILPDLILSVTANWTGTGVSLQADPKRLPGDLGPVAAALSPTGQLLDGSANVLGPWQLLSGPNVMRRVIGEGGIIPAPRAVGNLYGGLMVLQFAPIVFNPNYVEFFEVYGNNLQLRFGDPTFGRTRDYQYFVDQLDTPQAEIWLPRSTTLTRHFRFSVSALVSTGTSTYRKDIVTATPITVPPDPSGGYANFLLGPYILGPGESLVWVDADTFRVARLFERVGSFSGDPYEYQLLDSTLGLILFTPSAYNYQERGRGGRLIPLVGKVNYDVLDWRILREEFRIPSPDRPFYQLALGDLAVLGNMGADRQPNTGFPVPNGSGTYANRVLGLMDLDTGGVYVPSSLSVDGSRGVVSFIDKDGDPNNGIQMDMLLPGAANPVTVNASGRSVRVMYMAQGEWAVQVLKAPSVFQIAYDTPGVAQCYLGGSRAYYFQNPDSSNPNRIYFPWNDAGKKVAIDTIYYRDAGDNLNLPPRQITAQDFVIQAKPADPYGLPYIDIASIDPNAVGFDFAFYGYAVRGVKGASLSVRALWNPAYFTLTADPVDNLRRFNTWMGNWRRSETATFLQRSEN